jgi:hypothetical protein
MTRTIASLALLCSLMAGCATEGTGPGAARDEGYTPTGSNIPRRSAPKAEQPAVQAGQTGTTKPVQ